MADYAVLIPFVTTEEGKALLLEVRSQLVKQPGEICFPGGRVEAGETPVETAVRETCEELGLKPEDIEVFAEPEIETEMMADGRRVFSVKAQIKCLSNEAIGSQEFGPYVHGAHENRPYESGAHELEKALTLNEAEVADVFLLPVSWIEGHAPEYYVLGEAADEELPEILRGYLANYGEFRRRGETYYWEYEGRGIWGLTARIINRIVTSIPAAIPVQE
ncbi:MAG: CoA pyrophosphatase [Mogibacterium sp.]|nr:CoA pyrophosphatase [Mogibacterium sp.]